MKDLIRKILREETKGDLNNRARHLLDIMAVASLKNIVDGDIESMRKALKDVEESGIDWDKDVVKSVKNKYKSLMLRAKEVLKEEKKKLFIPRRVDERSAEFEKIVKKETIKFLTENNIKSMKYNVIESVETYELSYKDIDFACYDDDDCEIIFNDGSKWNNKNGWREISHSGFIKYAHIMSTYLNILIDDLASETRIRNLSIDVFANLEKIVIDGAFYIKLNQSSIKEFIVSKVL